MPSSTSLPAEQPLDLADDPDARLLASIIPTGGPDEREDPLSEWDPKTGKRRVIGKKEDDGHLSQPDGANAMIPQQNTSGNDTTASGLLETAPADLKPHPQPIPISPSRQQYRSSMAASPSRLRSSSPRLNSPASTEIFERSVQEPAQIGTLQGDIGPAHIPAHVITEDHIPPALEASAQAITSDDLDADDVEIVTSSAHQPAAASVLDGSVSHADLTQPQLSPQKSPAPSDSALPPPAPGSTDPHAADDAASTYGQLDPTDLHRLSFISFADVVHSEHPPPTSHPDLGSRDSLVLSGSPPASHSLDSGAIGASPLRSPDSSYSRSVSGAAAAGAGTGERITTPPPLPTSMGAGHENSSVPREHSPLRSAGLASPAMSVGAGGGGAGDLNIETLRQAVRKTASGDLSGSGGSLRGGDRSVGAMSPVSVDGVEGSGFGGGRGRGNS